MTLPFAGAAVSVKSGSAMAIVAGTEVLPANFWSPPYEAVREWVPTDRVSTLRTAVPESSRAAEPKLELPSWNAI